MADVQELVVKAKPQNVEETADEFQNMEERLDETASQMDDTAGSLSDMANEWKGAMGVLVAGLSIATAGLLSQVPVVGEAMDGLKMVVGGVAYQLDKELRPVLQPLTSEFADLAGEIYKSDGILEGLDAIAEKAGSLGLDAIEFTLEGDKLKAGTQEIIEFVFPSINKKPLLDAIFDVNISGVAVLTFLFGGLSITASKVLSFVLPASISATTILAFVLPTIATAAVLSHVFDIDMTATAILGAIFAGIAITAALIVGSISWPFIAGAAIVGTLFAGVVITAQDILDEIIGDGPSRESGSPTSFGPSGDPADPFGVSENTPGIGSGTSGTRLPDTQIDLNVDSSVSMDGRDVSDETGRYRADELSRLGRNG